MTRDQDIERVLERWFTEGPTQMPDRIFEYVDHIDRLPQRRRARPMTRFVAMSSSLRLAAAAAVILIVAGAGAVVLSQPAGVGTGPSPSPSVAPSASAPGFVPAQFRSNWLAHRGHRSSGLASMTIGANILTVGDPDGPVVSTASLATDGRIALESHADDWACRLGDAGTYAFDLSADGTTLTVWPENDACSARSEILRGDWARTPCRNPDGWCLGVLQPGTYTSGLFQALSSSSSAYTYGQFSYAVPAGWENSEDWPGNYTLAKQNAPPNTGIFLLTDVLPHSQVESCSETAAAGVGRTPAAFVDWLRTLPGLVTTEPVAVTIGGHGGFMIDLSVAPDWTQTCPYSDGKPIVSTVVDSRPGPGHDRNIVSPATARYIFLAQPDFLASPDGTSLLIDIEAQDQATWDALIADAMPIVESFQFDH
jgi:hypothetical protein